MRLIPLALAILLLPVAAHADCQSAIASAMRRAQALPPTAGRAALMEQIQRAEVARHEDDKADCLEQLGSATAVLDSIDAAKARAAAAAAVPPAKAEAPAPATKEKPEAKEQPADRDRKPEAAKP